MVKIEAENNPISPPIPSLLLFSIFDPPKYKTKATLPRRYWFVAYYQSEVLRVEEYVCTFTLMTNSVSMEARPRATEHP